MSTRDSNEIFGSMGSGMPKRNVMQEDFGYEIPVESVPLPSRGICYSEENPLSMAETVDIRSMTAKDEDILTSRALIKKGTVIRPPPIPNNPATKPAGIAVKAINKII